MGGDCDDAASARSGCVVPGLDVVVATATSGAQHPVIALVAV